LLSQPAFASDKKPAEPAEAEIAKLVRYLGSPEFRDRQTASARLLEIGPKALTALRTGTKNPDAEVARRCEGLIVQIRAADREALISGKKDLPGLAGKRFKELVGDSKASRTLFADMVDDDRRAAVAEQAAAEPVKAAKLYRDEVAWVEEAWKRKLIELDGQRLGRDPGSHFRQASYETVPPGEVVLSFFLGTFPLAAGDSDAADVNATLKATFISLANYGDTAPFRKLFVTWLENRRDPKAVTSGLYAALYGVVPEAAPVARRVASDSKSSAELLGTAVIALGNLGSAEDSPLLVSLRNDTRTYKVPEIVDKVVKRTVEVQVRDQAAAMSLLLRRTRVETYGFQITHPVVWWVSRGGRPFKTVDEFDSENDREAAHKRAWVWLDRQPKVTPKQ
jgi:hypothetical protein